MIKFLKYSSVLLIAVSILACGDSGSSQISETAEPSLTKGWISWTDEQGREHWAEGYGDSQGLTVDSAENSDTADTTLNTHDLMFAEDPTPQATPKPKTCVYGTLIPCASGVCCKTGGNTAPCKFCF